MRSRRQVIDSAHELRALTSVVRLASAATNMGPWNIKLHCRSRNTAIELISRVQGLNALPLMKLIFEFKVKFAIGSNPLLTE